MSNRYGLYLTTLLMFSGSSPLIAAPIYIDCVTQVQNKGNVEGLVDWLNKSLDSTSSVKSLPPGLTVNVYQDTALGAVYLGSLATGSNGRIQGPVSPSFSGPADLIFEIPLETNLAWARRYTSIFTTKFRSQVFGGVEGSFLGPVTIYSTEDSEVIGGANVLKEIYVMDKWIHDRLSNFESRAQIETILNPEVGRTGFHKDEYIWSEFLEFSNPHMFIRETVYHEYAHALMYTLYDGVPPSFAYAGSHNLPTISDPGFAFSEGWAEFMMDLVSNNPSLVGDAATSMTLETNTFWKGDFFPSASGIGHSGEVVEGAVASVLWDITDPADDDGVASDFATLWAAVSQAKPSNFKEFWDAFMARSPTVKKQEFRKICETHGIVYSRAKVVGVDKKLDGIFSPPTSSDSIGKKAKVRIQPFLSSELNLGTSAENTGAARLLILNEPLPANNSDAFIDARLQDLSNWTIVGEDADPSDGLEVLIDTELLSLQDGQYAFLAQVRDENGTYDTFFPDQRSFQSTAVSLRGHDTLIHFTMGHRPRITLSADLTDFLSTVGQTQSSIPTIRYSDDIVIDVEDPQDYIVEFNIRDPDGHWFGWDLPFAPEYTTTLVIAPKKAGLYTVRAWDEADGMTDATFNYDPKPPEGALVDIGNHLVKDFANDDPVSMPSTLLSTITFSSHDPDLCGIKLEKGAEILFTEGSTTSLAGHGSYNKTFYGLAVGDYLLTIWDAYGNSKAEPFNIASLTVEVPFSSATSRWSDSLGAMQGNIVADAMTSVGIKEFDLFKLLPDGEGNMTRVFMSSVPGMGVPGNDHVTFQGLYGAQYLVDAIDIHSNRVESGFILGDYDGGDWRATFDMLNVSGDENLCVVPADCSGLTGGAPHSEYFPQTGTTVYSNTPLRAMDSGGLFTAGGTYLSRIYDIAELPPDHNAIGWHMLRLDPPFSGLGAGCVGVDGASYYVPAAGAPPTQGAVLCGSAELRIRSGDKPDLSDAGGFVGVQSMVQMVVDSTWTFYNLLPQGFEPKRFYQVKVVMSNSLPSITESGYCDGEGNCFNKVYPPGALGISFGSFKTRMRQQRMGSFGYSYPLYGTTNNTRSGDDVRVVLGPNAAATFLHVNAAGESTMFDNWRIPPSGFNSMPPNIAFNIATTANYSGQVGLEFGYDRTGLLPSQERALRILHITNEATGSYEDVTTSLDTANQRIYGQTNSLSPFFIVYPENSVYTTIRSTSTLGGTGGQDPSASLQSISAMAELVLLDTATTAVSQWLADRAAKGYILLGDAYAVLPTSVTFYPPSLLTLRHSSSTVSAAGLEDAVSSAFNFDLGTTRFRQVTSWVTTRGNDAVTISLGQSVGYYGVFAATDTHAPVTALDVPAHIGEHPAGAVFLGGQESVRLTASDLYGDSFSIGIATIYYRLDSAAFDLLGADVYTGQFQVAPGTHSIWFASSDRYGNVGVASSATLAIDALPPIAQLFADSMVLAEGLITPYRISPSAMLTLSANDPMGDGVSAGMANTLYRIDEDFAACVQGGDCSAYRYAEPFGLPLGTHTVFVSAIDNVGNMASAMAFSFEVIGDTIPPKTDMAFMGPYFIKDDGRLYVSSLTPIGLGVSDTAGEGAAASGPDTTFVSIAAPGDALPDTLAAQTSSQFNVYTGTFTLAEGIHVLAYGSRDIAGNYEILQTTTVYVDGTPPDVALTPQGPQATDEQGRMVVSSLTTIAIVANDPSSNGVSAGAGKPWGLIDKRPNECAPNGDPSLFQSYVSTATLGKCRNYIFFSTTTFTLSEGSHTVRSIAWDRVGNTKNWQPTRIDADATPPITTLSVQGSSASLGGVMVVSSQTYIVLSATDPVSGDVNAGVLATMFLLNNTPESCQWGEQGPVVYSTMPAGSCQNPVYQSSFSLTMEGPNTLGYLSYDKVANVEELHGSSITLDATPPSVTISSPVGGETYIAGRDTIALSFVVADTYDPVPSSAAVLVHTSGSSVTVSGGQTIDPASLLDGLWELRVSAVDFVQNSTVVASGKFEVIRDILPPRTSLVLGQPSVAGDPSWVKSTTLLTLEAVDDAVYVGDIHGMGVARTSYSVDALDTSLEYSSAGFRLSGGESHYVAYHSVDVLGHVEEVKVSSVSVDDAPPSLSFSVAGSSWADILGRTQASLGSGLAFLADDPLSGVKDVRVRLGEDAEQVYASTTALLPLSIEGTHAVAYSASDRLDNAVSAATSVIVDASGPGFDTLQLALPGGPFQPEGSVFSGLIADMRINVADGVSGLRTSSGTLPSVPPNMVAWWRFEGDFKDSSGHGNDLAVQGVAQTTTTNKRFGGAAYYNNGTTGARGYRSSLNGWPGGNMSITVSAWVYHTAIPTSYPRGIVAVGNTATKAHFFLLGFSNPGWPFATCNSARTFAITADDGGADNYICGTTPAELNKWFHVAATYDSTTYEVRLYVNGRLERSQFLSAPLNIGPQVAVGGDPVFNDWLYGYVDDAAVFGRALSGQEVLAFYQSRDTGKAYSARLSTDGGQTYLAVPSGDLSMAGPDGGTAPQVLVASRMAMAQSLGYGDETNQVVFTATDLAGNTTVSTHPVLVNLNPLLAPTPAGPYDGVKLKTATPTLSWKFDPRIAVAAIASMEMFLSRDPSFADPQGFVAGSTLSAVIGPLPDGTWYWKVRAKDRFDGVSPYSTVRSFLLDAGPPQFAAPQTATAGSGSFGVSTRFLNAAQVDVRATVSDTQSGLTIPYTLPAGTVGYWTFDEGSGTTAFDMSGNGNHATLMTSQVGWAAPEQGCKLGGCVQFSGQQGSSIRIAPSATMKKSAFTFSAWVYNIGPGNYGVPRILGWEKTDFVEVAVDSGGRLLVFTPVIGWRSANFNMLGKGWVNVAFTHTENTLIVYGNGLPVASFSDPTHPGEENVYLGSTWNVLGENFKGKMDDVRMYGHAATAAEMLKLYQKIGVPEPSLVALSVDGGMTFEDVSAAAFTGVIGSSATAAISANDLTVRESPRSDSAGNLVRMLAQDVAGNVTTYTFGVFVDTTPPTSLLAVSGTARELGGRRYLLGETPMSITGIDPLSGVKENRLRVDAAGEYAVTTGMFTLPHGNHDLSFYSMDQAGNTGTSTTVSIKMDAVAPAVAADLLAVAPSTTGMTLVWTSPGDDGVEGTILSGEFRVQYASLPTAFDPSQAQIVENVVDQGSGTAKSLRIEGLAPGADYNFALWTKDTAGNYSAAATASARTLSLAQSADQVASIISPEPLLTVTTVTQAAAAGPLSVSTAQGLGTLTPTFYELNTGSTEPVHFSTPAVLSFIFDRTGVDLDRVAIYKYMDEDGDGDMEWSTAPIVNQTLTQLSGDLYQITGQIYSASLYSVFEKRDILPPRTTLALGEPKYIAGETYLTAMTDLSLSAADDRSLVGDGDGAGVSGTQYALDGGAAALYTAPVRLSGEGPHDFAFFSVDLKNNLEARQSKRLVVDGTPPVTTVSLSTPSFEAFVSPLTTVKLSAQDPPAGAIPGSGLSKLLYAIGAGQLAQGPLEFGLQGPDGKYELSYQAQDNLGNLEVLQKKTYSLDSTPAVSVADVGAHSYSAPDGKKYVSPLTPVTLSAQDQSVNEVASGVQLIAVDLGQGYAPYTAPLTFIAGHHQLQYRATDKVGNMEQAKALELYVDGTAPATLLSYDGYHLPRAETTLPPAEAEMFILPETKLILTAQDPGELASGVGATEYRLGEGAWLAYSAPFSITADGLHTLAWRSKDRVDNEETAHSLKIAVIGDILPPRTVMQVGEPKYLASRSYVTSRTELTLSAIDDRLTVGDALGVGVDRTEYAVDEGASARYSAPVKLSGEGPHAVGFFSADLLGHVETTQSQSLTVDDAPPATLVSLSTPSFGAYVSPLTTVKLSAQDPASGSVPGSGLAKLLYAVGPGPMAEGVLEFGLKGADGKYELNCQAQDNLSNLETPQKIEYSLDGTPPLSASAIGSPSYTAPDGKKYVSPLTPVTLSAQDPAINEVASGLKLIEVDLGQGFAAYQGPLSFAEGRREPRFRSLDNVGNMEIAKSLELYSDGTTPNTAISYDGFHLSRAETVLPPPEAEMFVLPETKLILTAQDPGEVASGVGATEYRLGEGAWVAYSAPFSITAEGLHTLAWRSRDRVANEEVFHSLKIAVINDILPPRTAMQVGEPKYIGSLPYVTSLTELTLSAIDDRLTVGDGLGSGVDRTEYSVDGGASARYSAPVKLSGEGPHVVAFFSVDVKDNVEAGQSRTLAVDDASPQTTVALSTPSFGAYVSPLTVIRLTAQDPPSGAVPGSGLSKLLYAIGAGQLSQGPLAFGLTGPDGKYELNYQAQDNLGTLETLRKNTYSLDSTPPLSASAIGAHSYQAPDGKTYVSPVSQVSLSATDPLVNEVAAGIKLIEADLGQGYAPYTAPLTFAQGHRQMQYRATDNVGNIESAKSLELYVDGIAPVTAVAYDGFHLTRADNPGLPPAEAEEFISPQTKVVLTAQDPGTEAVSGVKLTEYRLDAGAWIAYSVPFSITAEGLHVLAWRSKDQVDNEETAHSLKIAVIGDIQPPRTVISIGAPKYVGADTYLTSATELTLTAVDDRLSVGDGLGLGVEKTEYSLDAGALVRYSAPIKLSGNGPHNVAFFSTDVLGHAEASQARRLLVDDAPPITEIVLSGLRFTAQSGDPYAVGGPLFIASTTLTALQAQDPLVNGSASGLASLSYGLDTTALGPYSAAFTVTPQGAHALKYLAVDNLGNAENLKTLSFSVDAAPPLTQISFTGPYFMQSVNSGAVPPEAEVFIARETRIVLTAHDPVVAETASGVSEIRYRMDGGAWLAYSQSLAILSGGLHTLEWSAKDRLGLEEAVHSQRIAVDVAAPISSLSIGEPKFLALSLDFVTPQTPIALSAVDLPNSGIAVGVQGISYRIDAGAELPYTASFTLAQGTHTIEFWAYDRAGNVEYRQSRLLTSTLLQTAALTGVDGITGSGTAQVTGKLLSNGRMALSGSVRVLGDAAGSPVALTGNASVSGIVSQNGAGTMPEPIDLALAEQLASAASSNALIPAAFLKNDVLVVTGNKTLLLATGTYVLKGLTLSGGAVLDVAGPVRLFLDGPMQVSGGAKLNAGGTASSLVLFAKSGSIALSGGAQAVGLFYAPRSALGISGNARIGGALFAKSVAITGDSNVIAAGEILPPELIASGGTPGKGGKTAGFDAGTVPGHSSLLAAADPSFMLRDLYVFPNPAVGGAKPVIHAAVGIADRVVVKIFDVSGRQTKEATLDGTPQIVDDGSGPKYAYEFTWDGHIPSGVYFYTIEAEKSGQKIRKAGRLAVVR